MPCVGHYSRRVAGCLWDDVRARLLMSVGEVLEAGRGGEPQ